MAEVLQKERQILASLLRDVALREVRRRGWDRDEDADPDREDQALRAAKAALRNEIKGITLEEVETADGDRPMATSPRPMARRRTRRRGTTLNPEP